jgi:hypothetical protein
MIKELLFLMNSKSKKRSIISLVKGEDSLMSLMWSHVFCGWFMVMFVPLGLVDISSFFTHATL